MNKVASRLAEHHITLEATPAALGFLAGQGYDPEMGARPLRRVIQTEIEDRLSEALLGGRVHDGDLATADLREGAIVIEAAARPPEEPSSEEQAEALPSH